MDPEYTEALTTTGGQRGAKSGLFPSLLKDSKRPPTVRIKGHVRKRNLPAARNGLYYAHRSSESLRTTSWVASYVSAARLAVEDVKEADTATRASRWPQ